VPPNVTPVFLEEDAMDGEREGRTDGRRPSLKTPSQLSRRALSTTASLAITVPIVVGGTMLVEVGTPAHAAKSSAVRCQTTKLAAAAKLYAGAQKCVAQSLKHALPPSPCLQRVGSKFDAPFVNADTFGTYSGTASAIRPCPPT
jgi:hypothetical protein